jgi:hypothetical protein
MFKPMKFYELRNTTEKPTQLPTTPMAEYELVNINGRNSYLRPKMMPWSKEQYTIRGIENAI